MIITSGSPSLCSLWAHKRLAFVWTWRTTLEWISVSSCGQQYRDRILRLLWSISSPRTLSYATTRWCWVTPLQACWWEDSWSHESWIEIAPQRSLLGRCWVRSCNQNASGAAESTISSTRPVVTNSGLYTYDEKDTMNINLLLDGSC